ncbi:MAG: MTH938/NDUFAF3 family protein [Pseudomonadota bacterium]
MELNIDPPTHSMIIRSYEPGALIVNDRTLTHSVALTPDHLIPFSADTFSELTQKQLECLDITGIQVILIGTGAQMHPVPLAWYAPWLQQRIGVEVMSTAAACRTFTLLAAEKRKVLAVLLIK